MHDRGRWSVDLIVSYLLTLALLAFILLPIVVVVAGAFSNAEWLGLSSEQWVAQSGAGGRWFRYVWGLYHPMIFFSLRLALLSVIICLLIGVPAGYVLGRRLFRGSRLVEELVVIPLSVPGIALSIALIQTYTVVRGSWWLVLCGHLLYTIPFMVRATTATVRSLDLASQERAAVSLGAGFLQRFFLVVLPAVRHAAVVGSLLVFAISWGEFNVSFLLNTPVHQTYPAALYSTFTFNSFQVSAAATTIFLAGIVPVLFALQLIGGFELVQVEQGA